MSHNYLCAGTSDLQAVLKLFGLPSRVIGGILSTYTNWKSSLGPECTIDRLKALKVYALSGSVPKSMTWIATGRDGRPKGYFGYLWRRENVTLETCLRVLTVLYSNIVGIKVTPRQLDKFLSNAGEKKGWSVLLHDKDEMERTFPLLGNVARLTLPAVWKALPLAKFDSLDKWISSPRKRVVHWESFPSYEDYEVAGFKSSWRSVPENSITYMEHLNDLEKARPSALLPGDINFPSFIYKEALNMDLSGRYPEPPFVGSIAIIQERGMKARVIANPLRGHQVALSRLGNFLFGILRHLPWDCTFNQTLGVAFIEQSLKDGKTVHSIDLTSATDNMPLAFSMAVMRSLYTRIDKRYYPLEDDCLLFEQLSRGTWVVPPELAHLALERNLLDAQTKLFRWGVGQPLGLYPSFPLFALSHGFILRSIELTVGVQNTFRVLGDDVVITNDDVAALYLKRMTNDLMCPISLEKTLVSNVMGEFAGQVVTKSGALDIQKWKSLDKPFAVLEWLGHKGLRLIRPELRKYAKFYSALPSPLSGLGYNPKGLSWDQRVPDYLEDLMLLCLSEYNTVPFARDGRDRVEAEIGFTKPVHYKTLPLRKQPDRTDLVGRLDVEHVNAIIKAFSGFIPPKLKVYVDDVVSKVRKNIRAPVAPEKEGEDRFYKILKLYEKNRKLKK